MIGWILICAAACAMYILSLMVILEHIDRSDR